LLIVSTKGKVFLQIIGDLPGGQPESRQQRNPLHLHGARQKNLPVLRGRPPVQGRVGQATNPIKLGNKL